MAAGRGWLVSSRNDTLALPSSPPLLASGGRCRSPGIQPCIFFDENYVCLGRNAKREFRPAIRLRYGKIPHANDIHSDQHISAGEVALGNADAMEQDSIGQSDVD